MEKIIFTITCRIIWRIHLNTFHPMSFDCSKCLFLCCFFIWKCLKFIPILLWWCHIYRSPPLSRWKAWNKRTNKQGRLPLLHHSLHAIITHKYFRAYKYSMGHSRINKSGNGGGDDDGDGNDNGNSNNNGNNNKSSNNSNNICINCA